MLLKFFLAIIIVGINPVCTLKAVDFYPDNLPDLFWPLRDHFYDRLAGPTATKENFKSTLCEFVRNYILYITAVILNSRSSMAVKHATVCPF